MKKTAFLAFGILPLLALSQETQTTEIEEIVFQKKSKSSDLTSVKISAEQAEQTASVSGGVETLLKTLPSVNSNTELSSQ